MENNIQFHFNDASISANSNASFVLSVNEGTSTSNSTHLQKSKSNLKLINSSANENHDLKYINRGEDYNSNFEFKVSKSVERIIELIFSDDFIEGEASKTQLYLEYLYNKEKDVFLESFNRAWVSLYTADNHYIMTFLNVASTIEYEWLGYRADSIVMGFSSISNPYVNEAAIRALESWGQKSHIFMLEKMRDFEQDWVQQYKMDVLAFLRSL